MRTPLELPAGVVADDTDFATGGWKDASNIRFWRGKPEVIKGWERLSPTPLTGKCRSIFNWSDGDNLNTFAFGLHNGLTIWQAGTQADVTPTAGFTPGQIDGTGGAGYGTGAYGVGDFGEPSATDYFPLTWSFGARSFGELYANPRGQGIFVWNNDPAVKAALLANAPAKCNVLAVAFTDQVMAFGCTDSGAAFNQSCIRISDIDDPTKWTVATNSTAQQIYLKGNGRIVGAQAAGRYFLVWTDSECHLGTFTTEWAFEPVGQGGLAGPNAAVVIGQTAYWISPDLQFWACPLGGAPAIVQCPVRDEFADNFAPGQLDKISAAYIAERGEIVWSYPDARDGYENSRQIRLSVLDGAFAPSALARTAMAGANPSPVGVTFDGQIYWHERGSSADGAPLQAFIETGGQYLDPAERVLLVRGFYPDFRDQKGAVWLTVWTWMEPQDDWVEAGTYLCAPGQGRVDFLASGRLFKFRLASDSSPAAWRLGKPAFDTIVTGGR